MVQAAGTRRRRPPTFAISKVAAHPEHRQPPAMPTPPARAGWELMRGGSNNPRSFHGERFSSAAEGVLPHLVNVSSRPYTAYTPTTPTSPIGGHGDHDREGGRQARRRSGRGEGWLRRGRGGSAGRWRSWPKAAGRDDGDQREEGWPRRMGISGEGGGHGREGADRLDGDWAGGLCLRLGMIGGQLPRNKKARQNRA